jgi:hypothetical protein
VRSPSPIASCCRAGTVGGRHRGVSYGPRKCPRPKEKPRRGSGGFLARRPKGGGLGMAVYSPPECSFSRRRAGLGSNLSRHPRILLQLEFGRREPRYRRHTHRTSDCVPFGRAGKHRGHRAHRPDPYASYASYAPYASFVRTNEYVAVPHFPAASWRVRTKPPVPCASQLLDSISNELATTFWGSIRRAPAQPGPSPSQAARRGAHPGSVCREHRRRRDARERWETPPAGGEIGAKLAP